MEELGKGSRGNFMCFGRPRGSDNIYAALWQPLRPKANRYHESKALISTTRVLNSVAPWKKILAYLLDIRLKQKACPAMPAPTSRKYWEGTNVYCPPTYSKLTCGHRKLAQRQT